MTSKKTFAAMMAVFLLVVLAAVGASAEPPDTPLRITISSPSESYLVGEPVVLDLKLTNEGSETVTTMVPSAIEYTNTYLSYRSHGRSDWTSYRPTLYKSIGARYAELEPGESLMARGIFPASMNTPGDFTFLKQPGQYQFRMQFTVRDGGPMPEGGYPRLISNTIAVTVREPQGREAEALELWNKVLKQSSYSFHAVSVAGGQPLMQLLSDYGDTTYAQYGNYVLAATDRIMYHSEVQDRSGSEYQAEFLERILETASADFPIRDDVLFRLAELYSRQQRHDEAIALLDHLISEMPDSIKAYEAIERRELFESYRASAASR